MFEQQGAVVSSCRHHVVWQRQGRGRRGGRGAQQSFHGHNRKTGGRGDDRCVTVLTTMTSSTTHLNTLPPSTIQLNWYRKTLELGRFSSRSSVWSWTNWFLYSVSWMRQSRETKRFINQHFNMLGQTNRVQSVIKQLLTVYILVIKQRDRALP